MKKILISGLMLLSFIGHGQKESTEPTITQFVTYQNLKEEYKNEIGKQNNLPLKAALKNGEVKKIENRSLKLYPKTILNSPFIYDQNSKEENSVRLYFDPENTLFNNLFLGGLYSENKIKNFPKEINQWGILQNENIYLYGNVMSETHNVKFNDTKIKNIFLKSNSNYITDSELPKHAVKTLINGSYSSISNSNEIQVDLGGSYGNVSIDLGVGTSKSASESVLKISVLSKIYSLDIEKINGIGCTSKKDIISSLTKVSPKENPVYISSIDYGFAIIAEIKMSSLESSLQTKIKASIEYGVASGNLSVDIKNALSNKNINVTYKYYGISPSQKLKENGTVDDITNVMIKEVHAFMEKFADNKKPGIPLSCKFKYLYPKDLNSNIQEVKINELLMHGQYYAIEQATFNGPIKANIINGHMVGVPDGTFTSYGEAIVMLNDRADFKGSTDSYWYFYIDSKKEKNISKKKYNGEGYDVFKINNPEVDSNGDFYVYVYLKDYNCTPRGTDIIFNSWERSVNKLNLKDLVSGNRKDIYFFNKDLKFTIEF